MAIAGKFVVSFAAGTNTTPGKKLVRQQTGPAPPAPEGDDDDGSAQQNGGAETGMYVAIAKRSHINIANLFVFGSCFLRALI